MRILIGHNHYQEHGGEDAVVESESMLLKNNGEDVVLYERSNCEFSDYSHLKKIQHLGRLDFSRQTYRELRDLIQKFKPDVAHFHNIYFMISPSAYYACQDEKVPVVQSLHNFRILCSNGLFYRDDQVCEDCLNRSLWPGIIHRCYKKSFLATAAVASMIAKHKRRKTWLEKVAVYITATVFTRNKYVEAGFPTDKFVIKPNFIYPDSGYSREDQRYVIYVGRLSHEKGIEVLLKAWRSVKNIPLKILGDGPLSNQMKAFVREHCMTNVEFLGFADRKEYEHCMRTASFIVVPSLCYENFPRIVAEAFSYGLPVLCSQLGSLEEIVEDGNTGALFQAGDVDGLAGKITQLFGQEDRLNKLSKNARAAFSEKYTPEKNYQQLISTYQKAINGSKRSNS